MKTTDQTNATCPKCKSCGRQLSKDEADPELGEGYCGECYDYGIPSLKAEVARLREELAKWQLASQDGHPKPCTLGELCPYCEIERLRLRLLSAAGDDLCRLSQEEIKAYTSGKVRIPPREEFLPSCERFHAQIAGEAGILEGCLTLAQLIAENAALAARVAELEADGKRLDWLEENHLALAPHVEMWTGEPTIWWTVSNDKQAFGHPLTRVRTTIDQAIKVKDECAAIDARMKGGE